MAAIWEARLSELVAALGALKESTALELLPDLMPTMDVLADDPEYAFQRGERYGGSYLLQSAVVGRYTCHRLRNPAGSGTLMVVKSIRASLGVAGTVPVGLHFNQADLATLGYSTPFDGRDGRYLGTPGTPGNMIGVPSCTDAAGALVSIQNQLAQPYCPASVATEVLPGPVILPPGWCVSINSVVVNVGMGISWYWEERPGCNVNELKVK